MNFDRFILILISVSIYTFSYAQPVSQLGVLKTMPGARANAYGTAYISLADDVNTLLWNPAGITYLTVSELGGTYLQSLADTNRSYIGYVSPLKKYGFGLSVTSFDGGRIETYSPDGIAEDRRAEFDLMTTVSASRELVNHWSVGVNGKMIYSVLIDKYSVTVYAADFGLLYKPVKQHLCFGMMLSNLGAPIKYTGKITETLPIELKAGATVRVWDTFENVVLLGGGVNSNIVGGINPTATLSMEYRWNELLSLRGLVSYDTMNRVVSYRGGFGVYFRSFQLDYLWVPIDEFERMHNISFSVRFGPFSPFDRGQAYFNKGMYDRAVYEWSRIPVNHPLYVTAQDAIKSGQSKLVLSTTTVAVAGGKVGMLEKYAAEVKVMHNVPTSIYYLLEKFKLPVFKVKLANNTKEPTTFRVTYKYEGKTSEENIKVIVSAGQKQEVKIIPTILPYLVRTINTAESAVLRIQIERLTPRKGEYVKVRDDVIETVTLHPYNQFFPVVYDVDGQVHEMYDTLAAWVTPNDPIFTEVLAQASELGLTLAKPVKIVGTQPPEIFSAPYVDTRPLIKKNNDCTAQVRLVYATLKDKYKITYLNAPIERRLGKIATQRIKLPAETLATKGNCIELAVLFASILESMELDPMIALFPADGHAVVGWRISARDGYLAYLLETNVFFDLGFDRAYMEGKRCAKKYGLDKVFIQKIPFDQNGFYRMNHKVILLDIATIRKRIPPSEYIVK